MHLPEQSNTLFAVPPMIRKEQLGPHPILDIGSMVPVHKCGNKAHQLAWGQTEVSQPSEVSARMLGLS